MESSQNYPHGRPDPPPPNLWSVFMNCWSQVFIPHPLTYNPIQFFFFFLEGVWEITRPRTDRCFVSRLKSWQHCKQTLLTQNRPPLKRPCSSCILDLNLHLISVNYTGMIRASSTRFCILWCKALWPLASFVKTLAVVIARTHSVTGTANTSIQQMALFLRAGMCCTWTGLCFVRFWCSFHIRMD